MVRSSCLDGPGNVGVTQNITTDPSLQDVPVRLCWGSLPLTTVESNLGVRRNLIGTVLYRDHRDSHRDKRQWRVLGPGQTLGLPQKSLVRQRSCLWSSREVVCRGNKLQTGKQQLRELQINLDCHLRHRQKDSSLVTVIIMEYRNGVKGSRLWIGVRGRK